MNFREQTILVTGGSRGIGRAIARQFAQRGGKIAIHYHTNRQAAEETLDMLPGDGHIFLSADLKSADQIERMAEKAIKELGQIDILINNAGIYLAHPLADVSYDQWQDRWQQVINTNLIGAANCCYCIGRHMIEQGGGRIVNISSRGAFRGEPDGPAYGASKAGLNAMSQSLAKYLAPYNIFVGVVAPGFVETEMAKESLSGESGVAIRAQSPLNRVASADEVAYAAIFLASEGAQFMTGAILDVNGASYLRT